MCQCPSLEQAPPPPLQTGRWADGEVGGLSEKRTGPQTGGQRTEVEGWRSGTWVDGLRNFGTWMEVWKDSETWVEGFLWEDTEAFVGGTGAGSGPVSETDAASPPSELLETEVLVSDSCCLVLADHLTEDSLGLERNEGALLPTRKPGSGPHRVSPTPTCLLLWFPEGLLPH